MNIGPADSTLINIVALFVVVVCLGPFILAAAIAISFFADQVRQRQEKRDNAGWRIPLIAYEESFKTTWDMDDFGMLTWVMVAASTWLLSLFGDSLEVWMLRLDWLAKLDWKVRLGWDVAQGHCVDRELRKVWIAGPNGGSWRWLWRIVCEYDSMEGSYRVTPKIYRESFDSEETAIRFFEDRVSPTAECTLRFDPKNPLRTELMGINDKILFRDINPWWSFSLTGAGFLVFLVFWNAIFKTDAELKPEGLAFGAIFALSCMFAALNAAKRQSYRRALVTGEIDRQWARDLNWHDFE